MLASTFHINVEVTLQWATRVVLHINTMRVKTPLKNSMVRPQSNHVMKAWWTDGRIEIDMPENKEGIN